MLELPALIPLPALFACSPDKPAFTAWSPPLDWEVRESGATGSELLLCPLRCLAQDQPHSKS